MGKAPLAWRIRPQELKDFLGQDHILSPGKPLREMIERDLVRSVIFSGPPGSGKSCLAHIIANKTGSHFVEISAVASGIKEIRRAVEQAEEEAKRGRSTIFFIDEIHRFNKIQQEALLPHLERSTLTLIGTSTENPHFALVPALASRTLVFPFKALSSENIKEILKAALERDEQLRSMKVKVEEEALEAIAFISSGDARKALTTLELACIVTRDSSKRVTRDVIEEVSQKSFPFDSQLHYDTISAFIKSMRGSDPDATLFWLALMLESGEDPLYIARRILIAAAEDVGLADPVALILSLSVFLGVKEIGLPEAELLLSEAALYVATAPKSNSAYLGIKRAKEELRNRADIEIPLHLRSSHAFPRRSDYRYPHDYPEHFVKQEYMPEKRHLYTPSSQGREAKIRETLKRLWGRKYYEEE